MSKPYRLQFKKVLPQKFLNRVKGLTRSAIFMNITMDYLSAAVDKQVEIQGHGTVSVWFWDSTLSIRKVIRLDFSDGIFIKNKNEQWFNIAIEDLKKSDRIVNNVNLSLSAWNLKLTAIDFFHRINEERIHKTEDIVSYRNFFNEPGTEPGRLLVEHNFINWIVFHLEKNNFIIIERDDQVGVFNVYFNARNKLKQIKKEIIRPTWGRVEVQTIE